MTWPIHAGAVQSDVTDRKSGKASGGGLPQRREAMPHHRWRAGPIAGEADRAPGLVKGRGD